MYTFIKNNIFPALLLLAISTACTQDENYPVNSGAPAEIVGTIGDVPAETKATLRTDDNISYSGFESDDAVGFFAKGGLKAKNEKLIYKSGSFLSDKGKDLQWFDGDATGIVSYYPYSTDSNAVDIWRDAETGKTWKEGFNDFLIATNNRVANGTLVSLGYKHTFAILMIKRGYGFNTQTSDEDIKVTLNAKVGKTGKFSNGTLTLVKDESDGVQVLTANKGTYSNYWYVIIPVGEYEGGGSCTTQSITLTNNAGVAVTIPYTCPNKGNTKYLVTAKMRDDKAVIETEEIRVWDKDEINIEKPAGISNYNDFDIWLAAYNDYKSGTNTETNGEKLSKYGTQVEGKNNWTFRLLGDIKIDQSQWGEDKTVVITTFAAGDTFDGQGHTITGIKLGINSAANNSGFFGTLSGTVENLRLENISVNGSKNTGAIAGTVENRGHISNCHVEGASYVVGTSNVGGIAGSNSGTVEKCSSSAMVTGTSNVQVLVGSGTESTNNGISTGQVITNNN